MNKMDNSLRTIFAEALEIEDPQRRAAYLSQACGQDLALRQGVEELIQAEGAAGKFLPHKPAAEAARAALVGASEALGLRPATLKVSATEMAGDRIGRYKLLQQIGEGGCGIVYMAEQEEPVRRRVALKVIKLGMDTKSVVARFEAERQAVALMDHPNIAKVLDAGATETGRPYFVMELVRGMKITDYCDENNLSTEARLDLFIKVCQAVQHAHQKGIIHRDLKPSNILVTVNDGVAVPKVIDFGIAKATQGRLTDQTLFTAFEQFIGTPAYMSPEQAVLTSVDIDTRSDIYSLGVLLYELLTGKTPFDTQALLSVGLDEMRRTIQEKEPVRPSTRLRTMLAGDLDTTARHHQTDSPRLIHLLRGDLDWIVMRCLEKDRARRYETANGLAMDIQRHLNDEPVIACPPGPAYRIQKFVRRNKVIVAAAAVVATVLVMGTFVSTWQAIRAIRAVADAREKLRGSYLAQAQAGRWSRRAGRRFDGLELLKKAAKLGPSLQLRNEAIACMALADLRVLKDWEAFPVDRVSGTFDAKCERYVFGDAQGTMHVRRVQDEAELAQFPGYEPPFIAFEFSPDGRSLFVASGRKFDRVEVLDLERKNTILRLSETNYRTMGFSADSHLLAVGYDLKESNWPIRVFDLTRREEVTSFKHGSLPYFIRFNPKQPNRLLSCDGSPIVRVWDWTAGRILQSLAHPNWVQGIDWHPDGEIVATACGDSKVRLWDATSGQERAALAGHDAAAVCVTFSQDGTFLASHGWDGALRLWEIAARHELVSRPANWVSRFSSTDSKLGISPGPGRIAVLDFASGHGYRLLRSDSAADGRSVDCDFSPDGRLLVSSHEHSMRLWDTAEAKELVKVPKPPWAPSVVFHPGGTNLFLGTRDGVEDWSLEEPSPGNHFTLALRRTFDGPPSTGGILLSRDGRTLASVADGAVDVLDTATGRKTARLKPPYGFAFAALSGDSQLAATWTQQGTNVQIWDVARSNIVHEVPTHLSIHVAFSPNNQWFVVGDEVEFRCWNLHTWQSLYELPREPVPNFGYMAFSADSRMMAVAISRSKVRLVEAATGRELATLEGPDRLDINWIALSRDGTQLAVVGGSGPIQLWDLRLIRQQLASMKLDWELPPFPQGSKTEHAQPLAVTVLGAEDGPSQKPEGARAAR